jgi:hypothetical protein
MTATDPLVYYSRPPLPSLPFLPTLFLFLRALSMSFTLRSPSSIRAGDFPFFTLQRWCCHARQIQCPRERSARCPSGRAFFLIASVWPCNLGKSKFLVALLTPALPPYSIPTGAQYVTLQIKLDEEKSIYSGFDQENSLLTAYLLCLLRLVKREAKICTC